MYYKLDDIWHTADGRKLKVREMTTEHLVNTIALIKRRGLKVTKSYIDGSCDSYGIDADLCTHTFDYSLILENMQKELRKRKHIDENNSTNELKDKLINVQFELDVIKEELRILKLDQRQTNKLSILNKEEILNKLAIIQKSIFVNKTTKKKTKK